PASRARPDQRHDHPQHARGGAAGRPHCRDSRWPHRRQRHAAGAAGRRRGRLCPRSDGATAPPGRKAASSREPAAMNAQLGEALARLPAYLGGHVAVSVTALLLGLAISLPLALLATRRPALRGALLGVASIIQTIPSLALLALF